MYYLDLTDDEMRTLAWAVDHGYFPEEAYDELELRDDQPERAPPGQTRAWQLPEHAAWSITMHREEDPDSLYACIGGELLEKLIELENKIV